jgi:hypothetical protein
MSWGKGHIKVGNEVNEYYACPVKLTNALYWGQRLSHAAVAMSISRGALTKKGVRTGVDVLGRHVRNIFSENNSETPTAQKRSALAIKLNEAEKDIRVQMPVDVAVEEPRARVVGEESDGDLIS